VDITIKIYILIYIFIGENAPVTDPGFIKYLLSNLAIFVS